MSKPQKSRRAAHFERLYQARPDPWNFTTSNYEQQKYAASLCVLGEKRFRSALEVGCSIGVLTERLAGRCDQVFGLDFAPSAVEGARARCAPYANVRIEQLEVPQQWPKGRFDLILFSEILYFLDEDDLKNICELARRSVVPGGLVLLVNYTGETDDPGTGDTAAAYFIAATAPTLRLVLQRREPNYRLDLLVHP